MLAHIEYSSSRKYSLGHGRTSGGETAILASHFGELIFSSDTYIRCSEDPGSVASRHHATAYMPICMKPTAPQQQKPSKHSKQASTQNTNNCQQRPLLLFFNCFKTDQSHSTILVTAGSPAAEQ
jgi:hypothetical protein